MIRGYMVGDVSYFDIADEIGLVEPEEYFFAKHEI